MGACAVVALLLVACAMAVPVQDKVAKSIERRNSFPAAPYALAIDELGIYLTWSITELGGVDLDNIIQYPGGCIVSEKDPDNGGLCIANNGYGFASLGGLLSIVEAGYGVTSPNYLDDPPDTSSSSGGAEGIEVLYLSYMDVGIYNHLVYQYGAATGFVYAVSPQVQIFQRGTDIYHTPTNYYTFVVADASERNSCYGRFWNTFQMNITASSTYDLEYSITVVQSVTSTPYPSLGTTATQNFELNNDRPTSGCSS